MTKDYQKYSASDKRGRVETSKDPYIPEEAFKGTCVCEGCHAVFRNKRWYLDVPAYEQMKYDPETHWVTCPACKKVADHYAEGYVTLKGPYLWNHEEEVRNILLNEEKQVMAKNPLSRIISIDRKDEELVVETTEQKLAEHLGRALHKAHHGELIVTWSDDHGICRVTWQR